MILQLGNMMHTSVLPARPNDRCNDRRTKDRQWTKAHRRLLCVNAAQSVHYANKVCGWDCLQVQLQVHTAGPTDHGISSISMCAPLAWQSCTSASASPSIRTYTHCTS